MDPFQFKAPAREPVPVAPARADLRPPPWEGLDAKKSGRILLVLAITAGAMFLFVGYLYFLMITNPTLSATTLYWASPQGSDGPKIEGVDLYWKLCGLYVLCSVIIGIWLSVALRKLKVERFGRVQIFTIPAPVFLLIPGLLIPLAREMLLFLPPVMFLFAASNVIHPENPCRRRLIKLDLLSIVPMILGECFLVTLKPLGAATMWLLLLAAGLSAMALVLLAREEHFRYLWDEAGRRFPAGTGADSPYPPPPEALPEKRPAPPPAARVRGKPWPIAVAAGAVLFLAFLPPLWVLDTEPNLELNWQLRSKPSSSGWTAHITVQALVLNRGGQAAVGPVELIVSYLNRSYPAGSIERIDGFGSWFMETELTILNWSGGNRSPTITLLFKNQELDTQVLRTPALHPLFALATLIVIKAVLDSRKRRHQPTNNYN